MTITLYQPFQGSYPITQTFTQHIQRAKLYNWSRYNGGIDYALPSDTPVLAAADGQVTRVMNEASGYGLHIYLAHGKYLTVYAHLKAASVSIGQRVTRGSVIGVSDNTGFSTGPHLHFEARHLNIPFDPSPYMAALPPEPAREISLQSEIVLSACYNLRTGPSMNAQILATLDANTVATVIETDQEWVKVHIEVWIHKTGIR